MVPHLSRLSKVFLTTLANVKVNRAPDKTDLRIIQRKFFLLLNENICSDPSLEPSAQGGSNDGSQNMFLW